VEDRGISLGIVHSNRRASRVCACMSIRGAWRSATSFVRWPSP
jgi:hypothetical protein